MLLIYTFVFGLIFQSRWPQEQEDPVSFSVILFSGLMIFNFFAEIVNKSPALVTNNPNYVKKIIFPVHVLSLVSLGSSLINLSIALGIWVGFYLILEGLPPVTSLFFPLVILPLLLKALGVSWFLASIGVYIRDVSHIIAMITTALLFLSPIFFPLSALPEPMQSWLVLNPLTLAVEDTRAVLIWGNLPSLPRLMLDTAASAFVAMAGLYWFQKTRKGFADVL
tara:strand:+ start:48325 stop:48993 length:669 start_codon:yes stop_codon:yes gene_type:complete